MGRLQRLDQAALCPRTCCCVAAVSLRDQAIGAIARQDMSVPPEPVVWQAPVARAETIAIGAATCRQRSIDKRIVTLHFLDFALCDGAADPLGARLSLGPPGERQCRPAGQHGADRGANRTAPADQPQQAQKRRHRLSSAGGPSARRIA